MWFCCILCQALLPSGKTIKFQVLNRRPEVVIQISKHRAGVVGHYTGEPERTSGFSAHLAFIEKRCIDKEESRRERSLRRIAQRKDVP